MGKQNQSSDAPNPVGRPTDYTPELGQRICDLIATHPVGYETIRQMFPDLPVRKVVLGWRRKFPDFGDKYLAAKRFQAEIMVEEIDDMLPHEVKTYYDSEGNERIDSPSASLAIAKANNRKWTAARLAPKYYGDNVDVNEVSNEDLKQELRELREELKKKHEKEY